MGWREAVGKHALSNSDTLVQKVQNIQKVQTSGAFVPSVPFVSRFENEKSYPIPDTEPEFAEDERQAIIDADGGQDKTITYSGPVDMVMESSILGSSVDVILEPDQATIEGVIYSNAELMDLKSRGLSAADLRAVHEVKNQFNGEVIK